MYLGGVGKNLGGTLFKSKISAFNIYLFYLVVLNNSCEFNL